MTTQDLTPDAMLDASSTTFPQMFLVGDTGNLSLVYEIEPSNVMPGMHRVDTEHGTLYLDDDLTYTVTDDPNYTTDGA
jgi:hypothetical protein